jgi:hypothetical protein
MRLTEGEKVLVQRYSDKGVEFEKTITTPVYSELSVDFALRVAQYLPPGSILRLTQGRSMVTYRCGRLGGTASVTVLKGWKPKLPLDPREERRPARLRTYTVSESDPYEPDTFNIIGEIRLKPGAGRGEVEAAMATLDPPRYVPRGVDRMRWSHRNKNLRIECSGSGEVFNIYQDD